MATKTKAQLQAENDALRAQLAALQSPIDRDSAESLADDIRHALFVAKLIDSKAAGADQVFEAVERAIELAQSVPKYQSDLDDAEVRIEALTQHIEDEHDIADLIELRDIVERDLRKRRILPVGSWPTAEVISAYRLQ